MRGVFNFDLGMLRHHLIQPLTEPQRKHG
jgi:hypothetical protein